MKKFKIIVPPNTEKYLEMIIESYATKEELTAYLITVYGGKEENFTITEVIE